VTDYGEHQTDIYRVTVDVPHGDQWRTQLDELLGFAEARRVLVFRDNRGRGATGTLSGYSENDQPWGSQVGFGFTRNDTEEVVL
jgi:hypothetical protein